MVGRLGAGASATVLAVDDLQAGERRALKILRADADEALLRGEFARLSRWSHRNLVRVHDLARLQAAALTPVGELEAGRLFLLMELVRGLDPGQAVSAAPVSGRESLLRAIAADLGHALAHIHGHGLVHHDVKPANVLLAEEDGRAVLLDLGLATRGSGIAARGTPRYLAPEALAGGGDQRADLYALGATLFELAEGRPPFAASGAALVRSILEEEPALTAPWLSSELARLILALLRKRPERRPASARTVLAELARLRGAHEEVAELSSRRELLPPALVGRSQELAELLACLASVGGQDAPVLVLLEGAPGTGKSRLVEEALRAHRLRAALGEVPELRLVRGGLRELLQGMPGAELPPALVSWREGRDAGLTTDDLLVLLAERVESWSRRGSAPPGGLTLHVPELGADPLVARFLEVLLRGVGPLPLLVVAETEAGRDLARVPAGRLRRLSVGPLSQQHAEELIASMLGETAPPGLAARVIAASGGVPTLLEEQVRQWHHTGDESVQPEQAASLDPLLARTRQRLPTLQREVLDALAVWGAPAGVEELAALGEADVELLWPLLEELQRTGALVLDGGRARLPTAAHLAAWRRILGGEPGAAAQARSLHRRAAALLERQPGASIARLAPHLLAAGDPRGPELALRAAEERAAAHDPLAAVQLLEAAAGRGHRRDATPLLARLYLETGRYDQALALLDEHEPSLGLLRAQVLQRRGDFAEAERLLEGLLPALARSDAAQRRGQASDAAATGLEEQRWQAGALLGRLRLQSGRAAEAREAAAPELELELERILALPPPLPPGAAAVLEVAGLARYYLGALEDADRLFALGEQRASGGAPARLARFHNLRGMVATAAGELPAAAEHYGRALALVADGGDAHGRATYLANLGGTLLSTGRLAEALTYLTRAVRDLERLARNTELAAVHCNLANLLALLGDTGEASRVAGRGLELARQLGSRHTEGHLLMLEGDLLRRSGEPGGAVSRYLGALQALRAAGAEREAFLCELSRAEVLSESGELDAACRVLAALGHGADQAGPLAVAWARWRLAGGAGRVDPEENERALVAHCASLEQRGGGPELWRAAVVLGRSLLARRRRPAAREALSRARRAWEDIVSHAPELYRERMQEDPDARSLASAWDSLLEEGTESVSGSVRIEAPVDAQRLRRLLAINKRLNSELRLPRLLELIMDTVIELTGAERGFLLLAEEDGRLVVRLARNIDRQSLEGEQLALSRSIAERAARSTSPVVTVDAASDGRFQEALSVSDLNLRSVLAVPLTVKGTTVGTIYVDSRLRRGLFGEAEVSLMQDVADQAAIAIDNARLHAENRRRQREIEQLNRRLRRKVESQQAELQEVREELRSSREALQPRQEFHGIIGRSGKMKDLFHLLQRVTETDLPVVIQGESGTGKELVARALHHNGGRASRPFVSENCAAIPESLLESILFGHVRGAFTGADRDRKGLFEVASGGTLFLDEVGEMSAAMQTKLLRVLQDGEFRRVGGTQTLHTDVRVIAASNKDLARLVAEGRFREDLFYRLNVVQIQVPPLRERRDDIPLLVDHFLEKHAAGQGRRVSAEALALLVGHAWPGNVRELENEIMRAAALAGKLILPRDLSPQVAGSVPLGLGDGAGLSLRDQVEHLEQELIQRALAQVRGNHTQAARQLGLSRFGLLKKLRRYAGEG